MISETQAKKFCKDDISLIENYDIAVNDKIRRWVVHHRRGTIYSREGLKEIGEYYNRPAIELIFMLEEEHRRFHTIGNHHSEKTKKKISESRIGKHLSDDTKKKISKSLSKPILQYTKDGEFIKEWIGAREAARFLGIYQSHISDCCKGKRKSAGGFVWSYADDKLPNIQVINT